MQTRTASTSVSSLISPSDCKPDTWFRVGNSATVTLPWFSPLLATQLPLSSGKVGSIR
uniref:Uncharacterized protein n=1 Tax=Anguilla anguilla TaxID=7936 RepID=A0A0E9WAG2_ANGAN